MFEFGPGVLPVSRGYDSAARDSRMGFPLSVPLLAPPGHPYDAMDRKSLFDPETARTIEQRINAVDSDAGPLWGKMTAAQMMAHCAEVLDVSLGKELTGTPWFIRLIGPLFKGVILSERPYRKNSPTHPQYVMGDTRDFEAEKARLLASVQAFSASPQEDFRHPIFGRMTAGEKSWAAYRHLDHHLSQFGV